MSDEAKTNEMRLKELLDKYEYASALGIDQEIVDMFRELEGLYKNMTELADQIEMEKRFIAKERDHYRQQAVALKHALEKYGRHRDPSYDDSCALNFKWADQNAKCTCGLDAAKEKP